MKKIGLITIVDYKNYGNRLQNYATQQVLRSMDYEVITLLNKPVNKSVKKVKHNLYKDFVNRLKGKKISDLFITLLKRKNRKQFQKAINKKTDTFKNFSNQYISESDFIITVDNIPDNLCNNFDYFVVGSDQVWNPVFRKGSGIDFLEFATQKKRIAYAPSFGLEDRSEEHTSELQSRPHLV